MPLELVLLLLLAAGLRVDIGAKRRLFKVPIDVAVDQSRQSIKVCKRRLRRTSNTMDTSVGVELYGTNGRRVSGG